MSDTDSFIDEVTEEVRRDRLYLLLRRWGWVGALAVLAIVGGAAFNEYNKARIAGQAQELGDDIIAALASNDAAGRAVGLAEIEAGSQGGEAVLQMLLSSAQYNSDQTAEAVEGLNRVAQNGDVPAIYRQMAAFKALLMQGDSLSIADRRQQFEALATPGAPLRLLAEEQLALIDVAEGDADAALARLEAVRQDAEAGVDLQQRAAQMIVALGGTPQPVSGPQG